MDFLGNKELQGRHLVGYFAASRIAPLSVLPTLDWAADIARRDDVVVVSGFQSKMEREVLDFLLRGRCGVVCVLARSIYKIVPEVYRQAYSAGRVLFVSQEQSLRVDRSSAARRNELIAEMCNELVFTSVTEASSLYPLTLSGDVLQF